MGFISWIVFGLIAGLIAKFLMPGRDPGGFIITIILGIVGAVVGGFIGRTLGMGGDMQSFSWNNLIFAVIGALVLLIGYRAIKSR